MDTGVQPKVYSANPNSFIEDKNVLMERSKTMQRCGAESLLGSHVGDVCLLERKVR
jgi:hypothetical protein